jgi:error-prone DNA polymerase
MYAELHAHSAFSFMQGASLPEQLAHRAGELGLSALALTDRDDLGGQVRLVEGAKRAGIEPLVGAELTVRPTPLLDGMRSPTSRHGSDSSGARWAMGEDVFGVVLLAKDATGYAHLASLISLARFHRPRGRPYVTFDEIAARAEGLVALSAFLDGPLAPALRAADRSFQVDEGVRLAAPWIEAFGDDWIFEVQNHALPEERRALEATLRIAERFGRTAERGCPHGVVATNHVHHVTRELKPVEDVLRCIRHQVPIDLAGDRLFPNDLRSMPSSREMLQRFRQKPALVRASTIVAERCAFRLARDLRAPLPIFPEADGETLDQRLRRLSYEGAAIRYPHLDERHRKQIEHELALIERMRFAGYFLILREIVDEARRRKILVQGRGSAANSAVCYCLGITAVDPIGRDLLFERFLSEGRNEPPDIDLDIEHERREELLQWVYGRYGRDHAAMVAAVHTYQPRAAAKDAARALGLSATQGAALASLCDRYFGMDGWGGSHAAMMNDSPKHPSRPRSMDEKGGVRAKISPDKARDGSEIRMTADRLSDPEALRSVGLDPNDQRVAMVPWLVRRMVGLPRHRGTHTGGFVLSERPIGEVCPVEWAAMPGRSILQWEKDDLATLGLVKFDLLGLGMLTVLAKHLDLIERHRGQRLDIWQLPHDDPDVYDDICAADTVGVFQIESRAQMNTLPRLRPRQFYDLVVEVALIRPGPIQGEMVHPYLRRRRGEEPVTFLHPSLEPHLARTLGVPLFQEQGMKVAIEVAGFSPAEADELRRAMGHKRSAAAMAKIGEKIESRMVERGIAAEIASRIVKQLAAFSDYGFPESHAASFALLVYASAYLRHHFTPEFYAAILNAQPMGFYSPSSLVEDAKRHHVVVLPPDVTRSRWDCTIEPTPPLVERSPHGSNEADDAGFPSDARRTALPAASPIGVGAFADRKTTRTLGHPHALRIGLRYVRGLGDAARERLERAIDPPPRSIDELARRSALDAHQLLALAAAGALGALEPDRRQATWQVLRAARGAAGPLELPGLERWAPTLPAMREGDRIAADFRHVGLSPNDHPMRLLRATLDARGVVTARALARCSRRQVRIAGLVICRQRPATAKGFVFLTLEDEGGMVNVVVEPDLFERDRSIIVGSPVLEIEGELQREQDVVNVKARAFRPLPTPWAASVRSHDFH